MPTCVSGFAAEIEIWLRHIVRLEFNGRVCMYVCVRVCVCTPVSVCEFNGIFLHLQGAQSRGFDY